MPPANFVVASAMADAVYTIADMRAHPVKVSPVLDEPAVVPDEPVVRSPRKRRKKPKQRTLEEIEERFIESMKKRTTATINSLNLAPSRTAIDAEVQEKLELFEKNIYRGVSYCYHMHGVYESRAEAIAKTYAIRQLP